MPAHPWDVGHLIGFCTQTGHAQPCPSAPSTGPIHIAEGSWGRPPPGSASNPQPPRQPQCSSARLSPVPGLGAGSALAECPGQAPGLAGHPVTHRINMKTASHQTYVQGIVCPGLSPACRGSYSIAEDPDTPQGRITGSSACPAHQASQAQTPNSRPFARLCHLGGGRERGLCLAKGYPLHPSQLMSS